MKLVPIVLVTTACGATPDAREASSLPARDQPPALVALDHAPADAIELTVDVLPGACTVTDEYGVKDDTLHVPIGRAVRLILSSSDELDVALVDRTASPFGDAAGRAQGPAGDVPVHVHVARGTFAQLAFRIDRPGAYRWQCPTQAPPQAIVAATPEEYAAYHDAHREQVRPTTTAGKIALAKHLYESKGCIACHTVDGTPRVGASFSGLWGTTVTLTNGTRVVDAAYVRDVLVEPSAYVRPNYPAAMPSYANQLQPWELDALVAYIESLGATQ